MILNRNNLNNRMNFFRRDRVLAILLSLVLLVPFARAAELVGVCYTASLTADTEVSPGDTFTVRLVLDSAAYGYQGVLDYDSSVLKLTSVKAVNGKYQKEFHFFADTGVVMLTHDRTVTKMVNLTFSVYDSVELGSSTTIRFTSGEVLNGSSTETVNDVSLTVKMVYEKSSDATLKSLGVTVFQGEDDEQGFYPTLNPAFDEDVDFYSATVPYEFDRFELRPVTNDSAATVLSETEGELSEGTNQVKLTVRAEDGTEMEYTLVLFRERPPEISTVVSEIESSEPEDSSEEEPSEPEESSDISVEESDEGSLPAESDVSAETSEESLVASDVSGVSSEVSGNDLIITPFKPEERNWTGLILSIAVIGAVCLVALLVRLLVLYRKKQKI